MPLSPPPPSWSNLRNKPTTVAGFGITDMASQTVANATNATNVTNVTTSQVAAAMGSVSALGVGSYILGRPNNTNNYNAGDTIAGSSLYQAPPGSQYDGSFSDGGSVVSSGTWRCMSRCWQKVYAGPSYAGMMGIWMRIS